MRENSRPLGGLAWKTHADSAGSRGKLTPTRRVFKLTPTRLETHADSAETHRRLGGVSGARSHDVLFFGGLMSDVAVSLDEVDGLHV